METRYCGLKTGKALRELEKYERYGLVILRRRQAAKLTLEQVARKIGSHKGYVSGIENDKVRPPSPGITARLCRVLGMDEKTMLMRSWAEKAPASVRADAIDLVFRHYL